MGAYKDLHEKTKVGKTSTFKKSSQTAMCRNGLLSSIEEYLERFSTHDDAAALPWNQFFKRVWKCKPDAEDEDELTLTMETKGDAVRGKYLDNTEIAKLIFSILN